MTTTKTKRINKYETYDNENITSIYLKEINKIPLLSRQEEDDIATRAQAGDKWAQEKLVTANLRFVVNVAKKYQNQGLPLDDLISEGNIGLMNAIKKYDVTKGYHFISYAVWWIKQAILKAICEKSRMIRLPLNRANELVQIEKTRKVLQDVKNEDPSEEEIARELGMETKHVAELLSISRDLVSLETPVFTDKETTTLTDFIEDEGYESPVESILDKSLKDEINDVLNTLSDKEADIIEHRYGLNGKISMSLKEIGDRYNLTKERIRQIEKKAITRLQNPSRSQHLEAYIA